MKDCGQSVRPRRTVSARLGTDSTTLRCFPAFSQGDIVANGDSRGSHNGLLYGIIRALCVVLIGGGIYIFKSPDKPGEPPVQPRKPAPPPPPSPPPAPPRPAPPPT